MYYGDEKRRQMVRSILPSTRRRSAKAKLRLVKKSNRAFVRKELRAAVLDPDRLDDVDLRYPYTEIRDAVQERQAADKLNHFERWAVTVTAHIPEPDGRLAKMVATLPKNLVGWHAVSHLKGYTEFTSDRVRPYFNPTPPEQILANRKAIAAARHQRRLVLLREIVISGWGHRLLNRFLRTKHAPTMWPIWRENHPVEHFDKVLGRNVVERKDCFVEEFVGPRLSRILTGLGDIDAFLRDLHRAGSVRGHVEVAPYLERSFFPTRYTWPTTKPQPARKYIQERIVTTRRNPEYHPEWEQALDAFLRVWEDCHGDEVLLRKRLRGQIA